MFCEWFALARGARRPTRAARPGFDHSSELVVAAGRLPCRFRRAVHLLVVILASKVTLNMQTIISSEVC
jgi:hypothetical protein